MGGSKRRQARNKRGQVQIEASAVPGVMPNDYDDNGRNKEESALRNAMVRSSDTGAHEQER